MTTDSGNMQQAVSKAVRSSLESLRRQSEELHQAIGDLVAACSSSRPSNALPATLRAQSAAAALAASLDVLSRFISASPQASRTEPEQEENLRVAAAPVVVAPVQPAATEPSRPTPSFPVPMSASPVPAMPPAEFAPDLASVRATPVHAEPVQAEPIPAETIHSEPTHSSSETIETETSQEVYEEPVAHAEPPQIEEPVAHAAPPVFDITPAKVSEPEPVQTEMATHHEVAPEAKAPVFVDYTPPAPQPTQSQPAAAESAVVFDLHSLSADEQEMHRRANRVAKVSMQDIQLLKPDQVILGRENHDLCNRLNEEIGKARKEYERRFGPILGHGVDYFYHWMVEVLAAGDPEALGEYPYSTPALRH
ncbi:MAG TPA: hypothetical protein VKR82_01290 [Candidatus Acidoferrales bacterium]|nr:hypothetical protein [Candidatus Acidoferrales bacterium]